MPVIEKFWSNIQYLLKWSGEIIAISIMKKIVHPYKVLFTGIHFERDSIFFISTRIYLWCTCFTQGYNTRRVQKNPVDIWFKCCEYRRRKTALFPPIKEQGVVKKIRTHTSQGYIQTWDGGCLICHETPAFNHLGFIRGFENLWKHPQWYTQRAKRVVESSEMPIWVPQPRFCTIYKLSGHMSYTMIYSWLDGTKRIEYYAYHSIEYAQILTYLGTIWSVPQNNFRSVARGWSGTDFCSWQITQEFFW